MEFGHAKEELAKVDFTLPPDTARTTKTLNDNNYKGQLSAYVGAPKWGEKTWRGMIYPWKTRDKEFLKFYCQNFNSIEFDPTYYNIYPVDTVARWAEQVASVPDFKFYPKFPLSITHVRRLMNAEAETTRFYEGLAGFGNHLGPLLLQLGEGFSPRFFPNLKSYLPSLPREIKVNVEVRHKDWFANQTDRNNLLDLLQELHVGTVIVDSSGRRDCVQMDLTTNEATIRFVGNNLIDSDYQRMDAWIERIKGWKNQGLKSLWFFMHQHDERFVPEACDYLITQLNSKLGTTLARPKFLEGYNLHQF